MQSKRVLGLTGGIASGKSIVSAFLAKKGGHIFDCDKLAHEVILKGQGAYHEILAAIEGDYLSDNGEIDRKKLGGIVFSEPQKLKTLEAIVHREVYDYISQNISKLEEDFAVIDAPILLDWELEELCDSIWIIEAEKEIRRGRLMLRNNLSEAEALHRINIQRDWDNIKGSGYIFIQNNGSLHELYRTLNNKLEVFFRG